MIRICTATVLTLNCITPRLLSLSIERAVWRYQALAQNLCFTRLFCMSQRRISITCLHLEHLLAVRIPRKPVFARSYCKREYSSDQAVFDIRIWYQCCWIGRQYSSASSYLFPTDNEVFTKEASRHFNSRSEGNTVLHHLLQNDKWLEGEFLLALLADDANINAINNAEETSLHTTISEFELAISSESDFIIWRSKPTEQKSTPQTLLRFLGPNPDNLHAIC